MRSVIAPWPSTRRDQSRLNRGRASPIRVPPDQSTARAEHRASASSGSRARIARVTLVRRVPKRKVETRRVSPRACRKCRKRRVYSFIDPEMSHRATTGGARSIGERNSRSITPPGCNERRKLRRASIRAGRPPGANRRVRRLSSGITSRLIALRASSISAALIWAKSFDRRISAADIVSRASRSIDGTGLAPSCADLNSASATRLAPASGRLEIALAGRPRRQHRDQLFDQALSLPEDAERLVEQQAVLMLLDEDRMQASCRSRLDRRCPRPRPRRARRAPRPVPSGRPASRRARAKWTMFCARTPPPCRLGFENPAWSNFRRICLALSLRALSDLQPAKLGARLLDQRLRFRALDLGDVVLIFEQHAERVGDLRRIEGDRVEFGQRRRPVQRFGDAGRLEQVLLAQALDEGDELGGQALAARAAPWRARSPSRASRSG